MDENLKRPFLYFKNYATFEEARTSTNNFEDNPKCIVFIANEDREGEGKRGIIWTHGTFFGEGDVLDKYAAEEDIKGYADSKVKITQDDLNSFKEYVEGTFVKTENFANILSDNIKTIDGASLVGAGNIEFDHELNDTSTNAVQNKTINTKIGALETSIRSALASAESYADNIVESLSNAVSGAYVKYDDRYGGVVTTIASTEVDTPGIDVYRSNPGLSNA